MNKNNTLYKLLNMIELKEFILVLITVIATAILTFYNPALKDEFMQLATIITSGYFGFLTPKRNREQEQDKHDVKEDEV